LSRRSLRTAVSALLLLATSPAVAGPGDHIRVGDAEIIPSVRTAFDFHSNVYQGNSAEAVDTNGDGIPDGEDNVVAAPFWSIRPAAEIKLEGPWIVLSFIGGYGVRVYIDTAPKDSFKVGQLNRYNDFDFALSSQILPNRLVGFKIADRFDVQNTPTTLHGDGVDSANINVVHIGNDLDGGLVLRPGSALDINVLGTLSFDTYKLPEEYQKAYPELLRSEALGSLNDRLNFGPILNGTWRFLPKTSLVGGASVNWIRWSENLIPEWAGGADGNVGDVIAKPDGLAWRTQWGVKGQVSARLAVAGEVGFGQIYYDEQSVLDFNAQLDSELAASDFDLELRGEENYARDLTSFGEGLLLNVAATYTPVRGQTITLAYRKDFQDVLFSNYSAYNAVTLRYDGKFWERLVVGAEYAMRLDRYHGEISRGDVSHRVKADAAWLFTRYLAASIGGGWNARYCADAGCIDPNNPMVTYTQTQYDDLWGQVGLTFTY
jgi:hypothetical protein